MTAQAPGAVTKGELCAITVMAAAKLEKGLSTIAINERSREALRIVRNHRLLSLPKTETWSFEEVLLTDGTQNQQIQQMASDRISGLERTYNRSLVPHREDLEYAVEGVTFKGMKAIEDFVLEQNEQAVPTVAARKEILKGALGILPDLAMHGTLAAMLTGLPMQFIEHYNAILGQYGHAGAVATIAVGAFYYVMTMTNFVPKPILNFRVRKAEKFGQIYEGLIKKIREATSAKSTRSWAYWGFTADLPQDYIRSLIDPQLRVDADERTAVLAFSRGLVKKAALEDTAEVALDFLFKFEEDKELGEEVPTLTLFVRYAVPKDLPPPPTPRRPKETDPRVKQEWEMAPGLVPIRIPTR